MAALPALPPAPSSTELKRITLRSRRLVTGDLLGQYRSAFRGTGLVYTDIRAYQPGDDVKHIHWKATARTGTVFVKSYEEDRQLRVLLAVDTSASMRAPQATEAFAKALEFASLVGALTQRGNDQLGMFRFGATAGSFLPPKSGRRRSSQVLSQLLSPAPPSATTDIAGALHHLVGVLRKPSIVFLLSDFFALPFRAELKTLCSRHDVVLVHIQTPLETMERLGLVLFNDAETGQRVMVDTSSSAVRRRWRQLADANRAEMSGLARECGAEHILVTDSASRPLIRLMRERASRGVR